MIMNPINGARRTFVLPNTGHRPAMRAALVVLALAARAAASTAPPIIDVGPLLGGSAAERQSVVRQIGDACTSVGFFYVVGAVRGHLRRLSHREGE